MPSKSVKLNRNTISCKESQGKKGTNHSREVILKAAIAEFSERGFDGARMETISNKAGYNKSLVYRYFTDKKGLFRAALKFKLQERGELFSHMPKDLAKNLNYWFRETLRDPEYLRLLIREALNDDGGEIVEQDSRRHYYKNHVNAARQMQKSGQLSSAYDPECFIIAVIALILFPAVFPQVVRLVTGRKVTSQSFRRRWNQLLTQLAETL
ncbi:MAG: TetR/AcrR family transcriptional regulator [Phycisphaerae bacterium]